MARGGIRSGSGRKKVGDSQIKVTLENEIIETINEAFDGQSQAEKIRKCLQKGIETVENIENRPKVLDMFCGCGGLSRGFIDAGYDVVLGIDKEAIALKSFEANHGNAKGINVDLFKENAIDIIVEALNGAEIDVLVGGPPCQGFSLAGKREENDDRNRLYKSMVELAERIKPKAVVIENVPGLATLYKGKAKEQILSDFRGLGYTMTEPQVLYAPDYGVPQIRKRLFFVGLLNSEEEFKYPEPSHTPDNYVTAEDAIGDLPSLENNYGECPTIYPKTNKPLSEYQKFMRRGSNHLTNHLGSKHEEKTVYLISKVPEGKNYKALPDDCEICVEFKENAKYNEALTRYHRNKPSRTIDTGHRTHFHYIENRVPSVRENARFQSFPDSFYFYGNKSEQYRQVGNAVPPLLGFHLGRQIKKYLK